MVPTMEHFNEELDAIGEESDDIETDTAQADYCHWRTS